MEKRKLRSRAYPSVSLKEAVELLQTLTDDLGWDLQDRNDIARVWGYGNSGIAARKTAALVHFGLLGLRDGLYFPTELGKQILDEKDENALRASLQEACLNPALFREVILRYEALGRVPQELAETLTLDHGIQENARSEVVQIFLDSACHAGILEEGGRFRDDYFEVTGRPRPLARLGPALTMTSVGHADLQATGPDLTTSSEQVLQFPIASGWVKIYLPERINENDIRLLRAQIDFLELQVSLHRPAPTARLGLLRKDPKG